MDTKSEKDISGATDKFISQAIESSEPSPPPLFTNFEKAAIMEMRKLHMDALQVDVDIHNRIYKMEKMLEPRFEMMYDRRSKLLSDYRNKVLATEKAADYNGQIAHFWLHVLKASLVDFITEDDEKILVHLTDVRSKTFLEPEVKFVLQFFFEPNEFFDNKVLTKTYFINILPNPESPLSYDGAEIIASEGCDIDWKCKGDNRDIDSDKKDVPRLASFFDFFNLPKVKPGYRSDDLNSGVETLLQYDFDMGSLLKESVIPRAVFFFTGEVVGCQLSESDSDSEKIAEEINETEVDKFDYNADENKYEKDEGDGANHNETDNDGKSSCKSIAKSKE